MNETVKLNFNNPDGSFNRDKWLDFMHTSIQSIPKINSWVGGKDFIDSKTNKIKFNLSSCQADNIAIRMPNNLYEYFGDKGWTAGIQPEPYIFTDDEYSMGTMTTDKNMLFRLANVYSWGYTFLVVYPDRTWRYLGFWEYAQYGLKKYIPFKVQDQLKKLGVL
tara:strand:+ start:700 stop:1188 length:489 start_codon:yes stop_codon:yes gene_type:complete